MIKYSIISSTNTKHAFPVENIALTKGHWETDDIEAIVDLKFKPATAIGKIEIENYGSAFIEFLVKNKADKEFQVLVPITMIRSIGDCKAGKHKFDKRKFLSSKNFAKGMAGREWEYMRISIRNPWEETCIGLSRLNLFSEEDDDDADDAKARQSSSAEEEEEVKMELSEDNNPPPKPSTNGKAVSVISFKHLKDAALNIQKSEDQELITLSQTMQTRNRAPQDKKHRTHTQIALDDLLNPRGHDGGSDSSTQSMDY